MSTPIDPPITDSEILIVDDDPRLREVVRYALTQAGFRVREVPITFAERARGTSKMSGAVVREALWRVTSWGVRDRVRRRGA